MRPPIAIGPFCLTCFVATSLVHAGVMECQPAPSAADVWQTAAGAPHGLVQTDRQDLMLGIALRLVRGDLIDLGTLGGDRVSPRVSMRTDRSSAMPRPRRASCTHFGGTRIRVPCATWERWVARAVTHRV